MQAFLTFLVTDILIYVEDFESIEEGDEMSNKDSVYWQIYADIWNLHKKYADVQESDQFWDSVISEGSSVYNKYADKPEGEFAKQLMLCVIDELERVYRRDQNEKR